MARTKSKNSQLSFKQWGLEPDEDKQVIKLLEEKDLTANQLIRVLVRKWMSEQRLTTIKH